MSEKKHDHENTKQPPAKTEKDYARVCPSKLSKRELEELYFALVDNNTELKKSLNQQLDKIRQLNTKVARLANIQRTALAKDGSGRNPCCASTRAAMAEQNISILELKKANERMAERVRVLNTRLCSARQFLKRASPQPSVQYRCPKCNSGHAVKDAAVSPAKKGESKTEGVDMGIQETPEIHDAATEMTESELWMTQCKEECKKIMDSLQNKISSLEDELSRTHRDYSSRINRLEHLLSRLQEETAAARAQRATTEHDLTARVEEARLQQYEIAAQLSMEKKRVAELETQLKSALLSNEVSKAIETHLSNEVRKNRSTSKEATVNTGCSEPPQMLPSNPKEPVEVCSNIYKPLDRIPVYDPKENVEVETKNREPPPQVPLQVPYKDVAVDAQSYEIAPKNPYGLPYKENAVTSYNDDPTPQMTPLVPSIEIAVQSPDEYKAETAMPGTSKDVAVNTKNEETVAQIPFHVPNKESAAHTEIEVSFDNSESRRISGHFYPHEILRRTSSDRDAALSKVISCQSVMSTKFPGREPAMKTQESGHCETFDKKTGIVVDGIVTPTPDVHREYEEACYLKHIIDKLKSSVGKIKRCICASPEHKGNPEQNHLKGNKQVSIQAVDNYSEDTSVAEETVTKNYVWESTALHYKSPPKDRDKNCSRQGTDAPNTPFTSMVTESVDGEQASCREPIHSAHFYDGPAPTEPTSEFDDIDGLNNNRSCHHDAHCQNGWREPTCTHSAISDQTIMVDPKTKTRKTSVDYVPEQYEKLPLLSSNKNNDKNAASSRSSAQDLFDSDPKLDLKLKLQNRSSTNFPEQYEKLYSCIKNMDKKNEPAHSLDATLASTSTRPSHVGTSAQRVSRAQQPRRRDNDDSGIADKSVEARDDLAERTNSELQRQIDCLQKQLDELKNSKQKEPARKTRDSTTGQDEKERQHIKSLDLQSFDVEIYKADVPVLKNFKDCKYYVVDPEKTVVVEVEHNNTRNGQELKNTNEAVQEEAPPISKSLLAKAPKTPYRPSIELVPRCDSRSSSQIHEAKFLAERQDSDDGRLMMSVFDSKRKIGSVGTDRMNSLAKETGLQVEPKPPFMNKEMYEEAVQKQEDSDAELCSHNVSVCRCPRAALRDLTVFRSCSGTLRFTTSSPAGLRACKKCQKSDAATQPEPVRRSKDEPAPNTYRRRKTSEAGTYTIERPPVSSRSEGTSPDDTHYDISSIADSHPKSGSPEDKWTSTQSSAQAQTCSRDAYLSEGEVPNSDAERKFSAGEKPVKRASLENKHAPSERESSENKMESALQAINQELVRCRRLLQSKREEPEPRRTSQSPSRQLELRKVSGARELNNSPPQKCVFTLHIGTIVLSDEAVIKTRDKSLMLTWQFYEQTPAMTRMRGGRVVHFDFSTEYDVKVSDQFLRYLKHEELRIMICAVDKPSRPFAQAALPLRDALLNLNHRVDMSLALTATELSEEGLRNVRTSNEGDELGVLDLWCTLRAAPWTVSNFKKSFPSEVLLPSEAPAALWSPEARRSRGSTLLLDEDPASTRLDQDMDMRWNTGTAIEWNKKPNKATDDTSSTGFWDSLPELSPIPQPSDEQKLFNQPKTGRDLNVQLPQTTSKMSYESYPDGLRGRGPSPKKNIGDDNEQAINLAGDARDTNTVRPSNMRRSLRASSVRITDQSVLDMLRSDKWRQTNNEPPERDENPGHTYQESVADQKAERENSDVGAKPGLPADRQVSHLHMSDSKKVTIGPNFYTPMDDLAEPSTTDLEDTISITVLWLALDSSSAAMSDQRVRRLYIAYSFLGYSGADLETPVSLPKPKHHADKCYFDFKKTFSIGPAQLPLLAHMARQRAGTTRPDPLDCIIFSVVSEPAEDPLGLANCIDVGYAYLYLGNLLVYSSGDSYTEVLRVHEPRGHAAVCGVLAVRMDGLDVVRAATTRHSN